MHSRIISICGGDDEGIYFLTMNSKPFYRQLTANPQVAMCGIYPDGKNRKKCCRSALLRPGFTLRISGEAREVPPEELKSKAEAENEIHRYVQEDAERYPAIRLFCLHRGKGEIFDFDFEKEHRDHKLLRTRFAFGGETYADAGPHITEDCIECGNCFETCTFDAIEPGEPYRVNSTRCDECGNCVLACPADAIDLPKSM